MVGDPEWNKDVTNVENFRVTSPPLGKMPPGKPRDTTGWKRCADCGELIPPETEVVDEETGKVYCADCWVDRRWIDEDGMELDVAQYEANRIEAEAHADPDMEAEYLISNDPEVTRGRGFKYMEAGKDLAWLRANFRGGRTAVALSPSEAYGSGSWDEYVPYAMYELEGAMWSQGTTIMMIPTKVISEKRI